MRFQFDKLTEFLAWLSVNQREGAKYNSVVNDTANNVKAKKASGEAIVAQDFANLYAFLGPYLPPPKVEVIKKAAELYTQGPILDECQGEQGDIRTLFTGVAVVW